MRTCACYKHVPSGPDSNVLDAPHRRLKVRAADADQMLFHYPLTELERVARGTTCDTPLPLG